MDQQQAAANEPAELLLVSSRSESIRSGPGRAQGRSYFISVETKNYKLWHIRCRGGSRTHLQLLYRRMVLPGATLPRSGMVGDWGGSSGEA